MPLSLVGPLRFTLRRVKALLKSNRLVRNLIADIDNTDEFGDLYEHEQMIADTVRVDAYRAAIARLVHAQDMVVDLGTGTGILAQFAARNRPRKLYAIDHSPFIEVAQRIAEHNGVTNIVFVRVNSRGFHPEEQLDVILHEQLGDDLFDENMLENLLELKKRLLKPSGRIVPGKFELYLEPVCLRAAYKVPFIWEQSVHGIDFSCLKESGEVDRYKRTAYASRYLRWGSVDYFLCEPTPILSFDLNAMTDSSEVARTVEARRTVIRSGALDGLCLYFRVIFDEQVSFDTSPLHVPTHWANRLFRLPKRECRPGDVFSVHLTMEDLIDAYSWTVEISEGKPSFRTGSQAG
ncbi:MAG TPA: methyltransferase domain-containing protein [Burkholderiales bacterium]